MPTTDTTQRLAALFATILAVPESQVDATLSPQTCEKWDSLNHIHLVNGIEEEFGLQLEFEDQMRMTSFAIALEIVSAGQP